MNKLQKIVEGCKSGKNRAQRKLYDWYAVPMYRVSYRYLKNEFDTEEALSNGFMKVFDNITRLQVKSERHLFNWMKRIMINESLMHLRRQVRFDQLEDEGLSVASDNALITDQMDAEDLYAVIQGLPKGYRTIFNMYVVDGYSHDEIAKELNITESTSRSQLTKARKMLREQIEILELR